MTSTNDIHNAAEEATVMLGFAEPVDLEEDGPLLAEDFCSKIGGMPLWLNPEQIPEIKDLSCDSCGKPMTFLLQLYSPEDHPAEAFHRVVYVFCCKNGPCHSKVKGGSFKVIRSQLPQHNPYYPPHPPKDQGNDDDEEEEEEEEEEQDNGDWKPLQDHRYAKTCFVCGMRGPKTCSKCHLFSYCGPEHQALHWTKGLHKTLCGTRPPSSAASLKKVTEVKDQLETLSLGESKSSNVTVEDEKDEEDPTEGLSPKEQEYANKLDIDFRLVERFARFPEFEIVSEPEIVDEQALEEGMGHESSGDEQEAEEGWEEKMKALEAKKKAKKTGAKSSSGEESESLKVTNALVPVGDELYENTKTDIDAAFLTFQKRMDLYPNQVLRYARVEYELENPEPLYVSDHGIPKQEDIPPCPHCLQERSFEFQILPQLLNYLAIDHSSNSSLDFGTVLVYSCKENCHVPGQQYMPEIAIVQDFSEDSMAGTNMTEGPQVQVSTK